MFARLFGGGAPEPTSDGASSKEKEGDGSNGSETPQQQQQNGLVASHISKMDSIIRCVFQALALVQVHQYITAETHRKGKQQ